MNAYTYIHTNIMIISVIDIIQCLLLCNKTCYAIYFSHFFYLYVIKTYFNLPASHGTAKV